MPRKWVLMTCVILCVQIMTGCSTTVKFHHASEIPCEEVVIDKDKINYGYPKLLEVNGKIDIKPGDPLSVIEANNRPLPFFGISLSGGGTRAALYSMNIISELKKVKLPANVFNDKNFLDGVRLISTVSGGSIAGAYYVLNYYDPDMYENFDSIMGRFGLGMKANWVNIMNLVTIPSTGSNQAVPIWQDKLIDALDDEKFFNHKQLKDLYNQQGENDADGGVENDKQATEKTKYGIPLLIINAYDSTANRAFLFLPDHFTQIGYSLQKYNEFPVSKAVVASSSHPVILPDFVMQVNRDFSSEPYASAEKFSSADSIPKRFNTDYAFMHLRDGGLWDNSGAGTLYSFMAMMVYGDSGDSLRVNRHTYLLKGDDPNLNIMLRVDSGRPTSLDEDLMNNDRSPGLISKSLSLSDSLMDRSSDQSKELALKEKMSRRAGNHKIILKSLKSMIDLSTARTKAIEKIRSELIEICNYFDEPFYYINTRYLEDDIINKRYLEDDTGDLAAKAALNAICPIRCGCRIPFIIHPEFVKNKNDLIIILNRIISRPIERKHLIYSYFSVHEKEYIEFTKDISNNTKDKNYMGCMEKPLLDYEEKLLARVILDNSMGDSTIDLLKESIESMQNEDLKNKMLFLLNQVTSSAKDSKSVFLQFKQIDDFFYKLNMWIRNDSEKTNSIFSNYRSKFCYEANSNVVMLPCPDDLNQVKKQSTIFDRICRMPARISQVGNKRNVYYSLYSRKIDVLKNAYESSGVKNTALDKTIHTYISILIDAFLEAQKEIAVYDISFRNIFSLPSRDPNKGNCYDQRSECSNVQTKYYSDAKDVEIMKNCGRASMESFKSEMKCYLNYVYKNCLENQ